jgi:hypothetical protein
MTYTSLVDCVFKWCELKELPPLTRICVLSVFHHWKLKGCPEAFKMPLRAICKLTRVSHPTVLVAIKAMEDGKILVVKRGGPRVPNEYKVMVKVMVEVMVNHGVMVNGFSKQGLVPSTRSSTNTNTNINILTNKKPNSVKHANNLTVTNQQLIAPQEPKKLSQWVLRCQKEACESELKGLRDKGAEYAMGFEYDSKADRTRAKELRVRIKGIVQRMQEAET